MDKTVFDSRRRGFLVAVGIAPAAGIALLIGGRQQQAVPSEPAASPGEETSGSYHVTDHIRKYYATVAAF